MKQITETEHPNIKVSKTGYDPETGRVTSKIEYLPQDDIKFSLAKYLREFKYMVDKTPKDIELKKVYNKQLRLAKEIKEHLLVNYD